MIELAYKKRKLDIVDHSPDASLAELADAVETFASGSKAGEAGCKRCGECCNREPVLGLDMKILSKREGMGLKEWAAARLMPPQFPDLAAREKLIAEFRRQSGMPGLEATVLYEYNQSEPLSFRQDENDRCFYQKDDLCSNYENRPFICRLYLCSFGEKLQGLEEMIVAQGTWHAWHLLGAVPEEMIRHNPFLKADTYGDVKIKDFEYGLEGALKEMFIYF
jgi:Fe-S-cluster containining protein